MKNYEKPILIITEAQDIITASVGDSPLVDFGEW